MDLKSKVIRGSILLIILDLLLYSCAQVIPLSGGPRDTKAPELVSATPANKSTNLPVKGLKVVFKFNELVAVQNISQKLIINPLIDEMPEVSASGKTVTVIFEKDLEPNTTYFLQFGNSVVDIHENNPYPGLSYIFSTGPAIDTAYVTGKVISVLSQKPAAEVSVALYRSLRDSAPLVSKPDYITKTDEKGKYFLSAVKPGSYQVLAYADKNKNQLYDVSEAVGFWERPIAISSDTIDLDLSTPKTSRVFIKKKIQAFWGFNRYVLNDTFPQAYMITEKSIDEDNYQYELRNDTMEVYYKNLEGRSFDLVLKNVTSPFDTIHLDIPVKAKVDSSVAAGTKKMRVRAERPAYGAKNDEVILDFSLPVKNIAADKCLLIRDTTGEKPVLSSEKANEEGNLVTTYLPSYKKRLLNKLVAQKKYTLVFLPGAVQTFWGNYNTDTLKAEFKTHLPDEMGSLQVKLILPDTLKSYLLQVITEKGMVVKERFGANKKELLLAFYNLPAGDYLLRLIDDKDQNAKFTPAAYPEKRFAEKVFFYDKPVKIPAGWDVEAEWKVNTGAKK